VRNLVLFGAPYPTSYRTLPQLIATAANLTQRSMAHVRMLLTMAPDERRGYLADRLKASLPEAAPEDSVLIRRAAVQTATTHAVRRYDPRSFDGHIDLMLPCARWKSSMDAPLRWKALARSTAEFTGPDDCNGDLMLRPQHAATFAAFVKQAQERALGRTTS
jgi:hypothetical protein